MKQIVRFILVLVLLAPLASCKSSKQTVQQIEQQESTWSSVSVPVKVQLLSPQKISLSGTATMVRGEYILVSLRFLGFEVGQACITPENADMVLRQPSRLWLHEPVGERLERAGVSFNDLQQTLLGDRRLLSRMPKGIDIDVAGTEETPVVTAKATVGGKPAEVRLTWELSRARWDIDNPARFTEPGSDYRQTTLEQLSKLLGAGR